MATADLLSMDSKRDANKQKALDSALAQIERQFGKGSIMKLGSGNAIQQIESTSTGSLDSSARASAAWALPAIISAASFIGRDVAIIPAPFR